MIEISKVLSKISSNKIGRFKRGMDLKFSLFLILAVVSFNFGNANKNTKSFHEIIAIQEFIVTGTVLDDQGNPLPGVNISVQGTATGVVTDFDGNYRIEVPSDGTLIYSYVGFTSKNVAVNGRSVVDISMKGDENVLSEVVVVGYSSQTRADITGAVSSVDLSEATKQPIVNAAEALEGRVSGVTVINNGNPGTAPKINIRGFGTSNNSDPLYIIDGVQTNNADVLNSINPNDIEQFNVLKDASASIYGSRAANGVVIITTKNGGYGQNKPEFSFDLYSGVARAVNFPSVLNAEQHGWMIFQSQINDGRTPSHPQYGSGPTPVVPNQLIGYTRVSDYDPIIVREPRDATVRPGGTDWFDAITQLALVQNYSMRLQNGTSNGRYLISADYQNREGVQLETGFEQASFRVNSDFKLGDKVTIGQHLNLSYSNTINNGVGDGSVESVNMAFRSSPLIPVFDNEGDYAGTGGPGLSNTRNPVALLERRSDDFNKLFRTFGDVYITAELFDGLTAKSNLSGTFESLDSRRFNALDPEFFEPVSVNSLVKRDDINTVWIWTNTLNYNKTFDKHSIDLLAGVEALEERQRRKQLSNTDYILEDPNFYTLLNGRGSPLVAFDLDLGSTLFSVFGTVNYSYDRRYSLTATLRRDESSRFLGDNQSGVFPSVSAGWNISNESFFPEDSFMSNMRLRGSWGVLGNQTLPADNPALNLSNLNPDQANYSFDGSNISTGVVLQQVGNPDLEWETSTTINGGISLGFFDNALNIDLDVYKIETENLITRNDNVISTTAIDAESPLFNFGTIENTGFDISIGYRNATENGWSYGANLNISRYVNEVIEQASPFLAGTRGITRTQEGQPISSFFGFQVDGVFSTEEEVVNHADQGFTRPEEGLGRLRYRDINGDEVINDQDRTFIGSPHPDFTFGLNLNVGYKGFDVSAFFSGSQGNDIFNEERVFTDFPTFFNGNRSTRVLNSWTPENTNTSIPALSQTINNNETAPNSYFVEDGSFVRLKNLQIGYTFSDNLTNNLNLDYFRVYLQGTNLLTITGYEGFDPEIIPLNNVSLGIDRNNFPLSQIITMGVNIKI